MKDYYHFLLKWTCQVSEVLCFYFYFYCRSANYSALVTTQLILVALHMVVFFVHISFVSQLCFMTFYSLLQASLAVIMFHVNVKVGLGLTDTDAWHMIETIAEKNNIGYKQ